MLYKYMLLVNTTLNSTSDPVKTIDIITSKVIITFAVMAVSFISVEIVRYILTRKRWERTEEAIRNILETEEAEAFIDALAEEIARRIEEKLGIYGAMTMKREAMKVDTVKRILIGVLALLATYMLYSILIHTLS